jgi:thioredoxin 1
MRASARLVLSSLARARASAGESGSTRAAAAATMAAAKQLTAVSPALNLDLLFLARAAAATPSYSSLSPIRTFSSSGAASSGGVGRVVELSSDEAFEAALASTKAVSGPSSSSASSSPLAVLQFTAAWCGPCRAIGPLLEQMAAASDPKAVAFYMIDVDEEKVLKSCGDQGISAVPTFKFAKNGGIVEEATVRGADVAALKAAIEELAPH